MVTFIWGFLRFIFFLFLNGIAPATSNATQADAESSFVNVCNRHCHDTPLLHLLRVVHVVVAESLHPLSDRLSLNARFHLLKKQEDGNLLKLTSSFVCYSWCCRTFRCACNTPSLPYWLYFMRRLCTKTDGNDRATCGTSLCIRTGGQKRVLHLFIYLRRCILHRSVPAYLTFCNHQRIHITGCLLG